MTIQGDLIKGHAEARLDRQATVHSSGHQNVHARRYVIPRSGDIGIELMIIVKGNTLQLWCEADALDRPVGLGLGGEFRHGSETYSVPSPGGGMRYGRHTGLKTMNRLHRGDAWRFVPKTVGQLDKIFEALRLP